MQQLFNMKQQIGEKNYVILHKNQQRICGFTVIVYET